MRCSLGFLPFRRYKVTKIQEVMQGKMLHCYIVTSLHWGKVCEL